jgi:hypothetical protein
MAADTSAEEYSNFPQSFHANALTKDTRVSF